MFSQLAFGLAALVGASFGFSDAKPWILCSTSSFNALDSKQIRTSSDVLRDTKDILSRCPTDNYVFATRSDINAADIRLFESYDMPDLQHLVRFDNRIRGRYIVSEVLGDFLNESIANFVEKACIKQGKEVIIKQVSMGQFQLDDSYDATRGKENALYNYISETNGPESFTVLIYTPGPKQVYQAEFKETIHQDLRRAIHYKNTRSNLDKPPLFVKYQFFTPGILMGLFTAIVLFSVLSVGIYTLGSLKVSYSAFHKDLSLAIQKK